MRNAGCLPTAIRSFGEVEAREYLTLCGAWGLGPLCGEHQTGAGMETGRGLSPQHTQIKVLTVTGPVGKASLQQGS